jgi:hypothetical protein
MNPEIVLAEMKLIFLDFDGVLHPVTADTDKFFCQAGLLIEAIGGFEQKVQIVISSGYRNLHPLAEIKASLPKPLGDLIVGVTPVCSGRHQRFREIAAYLKQYAPKVEWRALDDDALGFPKKCSQLILCDRYVGLDQWNAGRLRRWLKEV